MISNLVLVLGGRPSAEAEVLVQETARPQDGDTRGRDREPVAAFGRGLKEGKCRYREGCRNLVSFRGSL